jgi:hypothetical protein
VYLPRLYLDHWLPVLLGWMCGFAKRRARIDSTNDQYRIHSLFRRRPLIKSEFKPCGSAGRPQEFPGFETVREIFRLPLVTWTPLGFMCLDFRWELERAQVQAIDAEVQIEQAFLPGLPLEPFRVDGIDTCAPGTCGPGAFCLDVPWTLSRPFRPSTIGCPKPQISARKSVLARPHLADRTVHHSHS